MKDVSTKVKTNVIPATHLWGMFLMMKVSAYNSFFYEVLDIARNSASRMLNLG